MKKEMFSTALHEIPKDVERALNSGDEVLSKWNTLTPLGRNEWVCWITNVKNEETRKEHIIRMREDLLKGKKRPCCWPGCPHRGESLKKRPKL